MKVLFCRLRLYYKLYYKRRQRSAAQVGQAALLARRVEPAKLSA
jgi:hypothetical protein